MFYLLYESAAGYALFEVKGAEEIGTLVEKVQASLGEFKRFSKIVSLKAFRPFTTAAIGLANMNDVSEGMLNDYLKEFLETNVPKLTSSSTQLAVVEGGLKSSIDSVFNIRCVKNSTVQELTRAVRLHFDTFIKTLAESGENAAPAQDNLLFTANRGLAHSYGRAKIKFNVKRADNMVIQAISLLDQLDKDVNTFAMRLREWYSWHFPELVKIVNDNLLYARIALIIENRDTIDEAAVRPKLIDVLADEDKADLILSAARTSMGYEVSAFDISSVVRFP